MVAGFDSVSVCLSKGLGAPVGSVLCGDKNFIKSALRWRKMLGGGMRQAGSLAAAGLYALENNIQRLVEDHAHAKRLAKGLQQIAAIRVQTPQTNILYAEIPAAACASLEKHLLDHGIRVRVTPHMRMVTHLDITSADIDDVITTFQTYFETWRAVSE